MDQPTVDETNWPTKCPACGTTLQHAVIDFDKSNQNRVELNPGEMAAVDYCPNPDCTWQPQDAETDGDTVGQG